MALAAPWTPAALIAKFPYWGKVNDAASVTQAAGVCSAIANKGSAGGAFTAASGARPAVVANALGALTVLRGDGIDDMMGLDHQTLAAATLTLFAVARRNGAGSYDSVLSCDFGYGSGFGMGFAAAPGQDWSTSDVVCFGAGFGAGGAPRAIGLSASATASTDGAFHLLRANLGATSGIFQDGGAVTLAAPALTGTFPTLTDVTIRILGSDPADADIVEWLIGVDLAAAEVTRTEGYLAWETGLQTLLSAGHPWRDARPS